MEDVLRLMVLELLDRLHGVPGKIKTATDLAKLDSRTLLTLSELLPDELLPFFIQLLKETRDGAGLFEKLLGDHEEENRELVDKFFGRYMKLVLADDEEAPQNPLLVYLVPEMFEDIDLMQTREAFFKSQTIANINEFLQAHFELDVPFRVGEQDKAWSFFFSEILKS